MAMTPRDCGPLHVLWLVIAVACWLPAPTAQADEHAAGHPAWGYSGPAGPEHWKDVSPEAAVCGLGRHQSPIDIRDAVKTRLPAIDFHYVAAPLRVVDNGHTIMVSYAPGSTIVVGGESFELQQFHFHKPSEEQVRGQAFPMVVHLVHKNARGELAVVAVLLTQGNANAFLAAIWQHMPGAKDVESAPAGVSINATDLLPAQHGYYTFTGSLTTPPCSENVTWFVLKSPAEVSAEQVELFGRHYPHNARPVQPLNDRTVRETAD
jgi:carbonic anhydrase